MALTPASPKSSGLESSKRNVCIMQSFFFFLLLLPYPHLPKKFFFCLIFATHAASRNVLGQQQSGGHRHTGGSNVGRCGGGGQYLPTRGKKIQGSELFPSFRRVTQPEERRKRNPPKSTPKLPPPKTGRGQTAERYTFYTDALEACFELSLKKTKRTAQEREREG